MKGSSHTTSAALVATLRELLVRVPLVGPPAACPGAVVEADYPQLMRLVEYGKFLVVHRSNVERAVELLSEQGPAPVAKPKSGESRKGRGR